LGTPHQGGNGVVIGKLVANIATIALHTNTALLDHLVKKSEWLKQQLDQYKFLADQFDTKFCYETIPMPILGRLVRGMFLFNQLLG
jgi:hypothetical protein